MATPKPPDEPIFKVVTILLMGIAISGASGAMIGSLAGWYAARWIVLLTWAVCLPCCCKALYDQRKSHSVQNRAAPARLRHCLDFRTKERSPGLHLTPEQEQKLARRVDVGFWMFLIGFGATYLSWNNISHAVGLAVGIGFAVLLALYSSWAIWYAARLGKERAEEALAEINPIEHFIKRPDWQDQLLNDVNAWHAGLTGTADSGETEQSEGNNPGDA